MADGAEAVESWSADRAGEIAVGAAAGGAFAQKYAHSRGQGFGFGEKRGAGFAFERGTIETSANFELRARKNWTQSVQTALDAAHVREAKCAKIEDGFGTFGDDIYACAAFDDVRVHSDAATRIVPSLDPSKLARQFVNRVDAFFWRETCVRGAAVDDELDLAHAFASCLEQSLRAEGRLKDKDCIAAAGFGFNEFPRGVAADFFVGSPKEDQSAGQRCHRFLECFKREESLNDAGLHIENAGAVGFSGGNTEGHFCQSARGVDSIVVAEHEELARGPGFLRPPRDAQLVAVPLLRDAFDAGPAVAPFGGEQVAATVGGRFFETGRLCQDEPLKRREHLWQARFQDAQEFLGVVGVRHGWDMLATKSRRSKRRRGAVST